MDDLLTKVDQYRQLAIHKDNAHYDMALKLQRRHTWLGVPVIVTTAVVLTDNRGPVRSAPAVRSTQTAAAQLERSLGHGAGRVGPRLASMTAAGIRVSRT